MVAQESVTDDLNALWEGFLRKLPRGYTAADIEIMRRAYEMAAQAHMGQKRDSGAPYITHPVAVAEILADLRLDVPTLAAAFLHDTVEDTSLTLAQIEKEFGQETAAMVDSVTKLEAISNFVNMPANSRDPKIESLRKLVLAMVNDVRVMFIKLADRLHNMRDMEGVDPAKRRRISRETLDIYAPLAGTLGIYQMKWELEDRAFQYFNPEAYNDIAQKLNESREAREAFINEAIAALKTELAKANIQAEISGRPKHIYSIWRKMRRKGVTLEEVYDREGVRIIVPTVSDCYAALGVVHSMWRPFPKEFDDYIASPKDNQYQSLHTAVAGPGARPLEVQIRTPEMHRVAEVGVAAHWRYKTQDKRDESYENKIRWLRQVIDPQSEARSNGSDFMATLMDDLFRDRVYAFTPKGDVIDLPQGATPIDFAYQVHTEVGHRCRGARVNGRQVNLNYKLQNGDRVEIITVKQGGPSRDWLNPNLGFVVSARARAKIKQWLRQQAREGNIAAGRELLEAELRRLGVDDKTYEQIARLFNYERVDDFLAAIGVGEITNVEIAEKVLQIGKTEELPKTVMETLQAQELRAQEAPQKPALTGDGVFVQGVGNMLTVLSRCCNPMPPDDIIGFVTRGRGVTIHRADCPNVLNLSSERLIDVSWGVKPTALMRVKIRVQAYDRAGLLKDITQILAEEKINLEDASATTGGQNNLAMITATLLVRDAAQLSRVLARIDRLPNVLEVKRQKG